MANNFKMSNIVGIATLNDNRKRQVFVFSALIKRQLYIIDISS